MLSRDQGPCVVPELLKRFRSKNSKIALFSLHVVNEAFNGKVALDDFNSKSVFRAIQGTLSHQNKELRLLAYSLLKHLFKRCGDDVTSFLGHCQNLRPVIQKELKEELSKLTKDPNFVNTKLFELSTEESGSLGNLNLEVVKQATDLTNQGSTEADSVPTRDTGAAKEAPPPEIIDLLTLLPENFGEIPYSTSINMKKKTMEQFNTELTKMAAKPNTQAKNKDYTTIFNVLTHMLEDKTMLVYLEAVKTVELLAVLLRTNLKPKVKNFVQLLTSKYAEMKTAVIAAIDKAMAALVANACSANYYADLCLNQIASTHKNPRVKQFVIEHAVE